MSWEQLVSILREADDSQRAAAGPPSACPNDGEPLKQGPDGGFYCPWDGWRP